MTAYLWPVALAVLSNVLYQICAKSVPERMNPFASLTVTYLTSALVSGVLFYALHRGGSLLREYRNLNAAPFLFGLVLVGLEVGFIYAYKAGWPVSTAAIVQSSFLAVALLIVGVLLYHEALTWNKVAGVVICLVGLAFLNYQ